MKYEGGESSKARYGGEDDLRGMYTLAGSKFLRSQHPKTKVAMTSFLSKAHVRFIPRQHAGRATHSPSDGTSHKRTARDEEWKDSFNTQKVTTTHTHKKRRIPSE